MYDRIDQVLDIGVRRGFPKLQKFDLHGRINDPAHLKSAHKTLSERSDKECHFCLYKSDLMEIHHKDDNHSNWSPRNLCWACPLCHQVNHAFEAGLMGSKLIYLPDVKQQTLNHLQRMIIVLIHHGSRLGAMTQRQKALKVLTLLSQYSASVQKNWESAKLSDFALRLHKLPNDSYRKKEVPLGGLRVLFNPAMFEKESVVWAKEYQDMMPVKDWWTSYEDHVLRMARRQMKGAPPEGLVQKQVDQHANNSEDGDDILVEEE